MPEPPSNSLLMALPFRYRAYLMSRMKPVSLGIKDVLYEPDETPKYAHFLTSGVASIVTPMANGSSAEVGIWGKEGLVECFHLLGTAPMPARCFIQVEGTALRMPFKDIQREFQDSQELRDCVLQCAQTQIYMLKQVAACNRLHEAEERLARWFLMVRDRVESDTFYMTQEFLANVLGSRRTTVTAAAGELQKKGIIRYSRGRIHLVDPERLEQVSCECYNTIRRLYAHSYETELLN